MRKVVLVLRRSRDKNSYLPHKSVHHVGASIIPIQWIISRRRPSIQRETFINVHPIAAYQTCKYLYTRGG